MSKIREGAVVGIDLIGRIDALEVGGRALAFWGLGQVGVAIKGREYFRTGRGIIGNTDLRETAELTETLDIGLIVPTHYGNTVDPGHFVSHLYSLNPMRPQKLLRPGELLYLVKDPDD